MQDLKAMSSQVIWAFSGGNPALGEELKAGQGLLRPAYLGSPWATGGECIAAGRRLGSVVQTRNGDTG